MTKLIAFMGKKGCGKSIASRHLELHHGFTRISFADPLKGMLLSLGLSPEQLWGDRKEEPSDILSNKTPRYAMQTLGTEWGRNLIDPNLWLNAWKIQVEKCEKPVVLDDLRFQNEALVIKEFGGKIVLIERPGLKSEDLHRSEVEMATISHDEKIINNGSITELTDKVAKLFRDHKSLYDRNLKLPARDWEPKHKRGKVII